jgi:predicted dehydrogenase
MINIGIVGANELSRQHAERLSQLDDYRLIGIFDHDAGHASALAAGLNVQPFTGLEEMLEFVEAVDILSPVGTHFKYASTAIMRSRHVMLNGLLSEDIREARQLNELAIEANVNLRIIHEEKLHPELRAFKKLVKKPYYVECRRFRNKVLSISNESLVFDMLLHDIDLLINLIGSNVKKVTPNAARLFHSYTDFLNVRLEFDNGCTASLNCGNFDDGSDDAVVAYQKNEILSISLDDFRIRRRSCTDEGVLTDKLVNPGRVMNQDVIRIELEQFARSILSRQKFSQEAFHSYQSLRVAHQVIEKLHPSNLFDA